MDNPINQINPKLNQKYNQTLNHYKHNVIVYEKQHIIPKLHKVYANELSDSSHLKIKDLMEEQITAYVLEYRDNKFSWKNFWSKYTIVKADRMSSVYALLKAIHLVSTGSSNKVMPIITISDNTYDYYLMPAKYLKNPLLWFNQNYTHTLPFDEVLDFYKFMSHEVHMLKKDPSYNPKAFLNAQPKKNYHGLKGLKQSFSKYFNKFIDKISIR